MQLASEIQKYLNLFKMILSIANRLGETPSLFIVMVVDSMVGIVFNAQTF